MIQNKLSGGTCRAPEWVLADRYIQPGLAFCRDRGQP